MPHRHITGAALRDRHDHIGKGRPCVIEVVPRRSCRMIRVGMVEAEQLAAELRRLTLGLLIVRWPNQKTPSGSFLCRIRQRDDRSDEVVMSNERATALVRISLLAMTPYGVSHVSCEDYMAPFRHGRRRSPPPF